MALFDDLYPPDPGPTSDPLSTLRDSIAQHWEAKYRRDALFHAAVDAYDRLTQQAEEDRAELYAALAEVWRIHRDVGTATPKYQQDMRPAMSNAWRALQSTRRPTDPRVAD